MFTPTVKALVDRWAAVYGRSLTHQSTDDYKHAFFASGICSHAKKHGHEERNVVLILLLIFCSDQGPKFDKNFREERLSNYIYIMSFLLLIENFFRCDEFPRQEITYIEKFIPIYLQKFKNTIRRKEGMGFNFVKFHHPTHLAYNLRRFGPCASTDSSAGEHNHIAFKKDSRRTAGNSATFEKQVGLRQYERLVMHRAATEIFPDCESALEQRDKVRWTSCKYYVDPTGMYRYKKHKATSNPEKAVWNLSGLGQRVRRYIQEHILPQLGSSRVLLFTRAYIDGTLYHGEPEFPPCECTKGGWHDWAYVKWAAWGEHPFVARILIFLELSFEEGCFVTDPNVDGEGFGFTESGLYAIVEASVEPTTRSSDHVAHQSTRLIYETELSAIDGNGNSENTVLYLVHVSTMLCGPCTAVPVDPDVLDKGTKWLIVEPRDQWNRIFFEWMREQTKGD